MSTAKYNTAFKCIEDAKCHEQSGQLSEAKRLYVQGIEYFMEIMKLETNASKKQLIEQHIKSFIEKAEDLQSQIKQNMINKNNNDDHMFVIAQKYLDEAVLFDESHKYNEAINKYKISAQLFIDGIKNRNNELTKTKYREKISQVMDRIELLQNQQRSKQLSTHNNKPIYSPKSNPPHNNQRKHPSIYTQHRNIHTEHRSAPNVYDIKEEEKGVIEDTSAPNGTFTVSSIVHQKEPQEKTKHRWAEPPKYIRKTSSFAVVPGIHRSKNIRAKTNPLIANIEMDKTLINNDEYKEREDMDDIINIEDDWSSSDDADNMDNNGLIISYATHFKLVWSVHNTSNTLKTMVFEPILGENEFMIGDLATNECKNHRLLIVKEGGTDLDAFKPPKSFECIWSTNTPLCSFWRAIPLNGYASCGHIALQMDGAIGEHMESYQVPKFVCIKNKYFCKTSVIRSVKNIIWSDQYFDFYVYQQTNFTQNILSAMFCKYGKQKPSEHELYSSLDIKYLKKNEKPMFDVIKSGFLYKICKLKRRKKRYYVLSNENILYCYNMNEIETKQIDLKHITNCRTLKRNKKGFVIAHNDRKYELQILENDHLNAVTEWIEAIRFGYNQYHNNNNNNNVFIDSDNDGNDMNVETKGKDILIINDYTAAKSEGTGFIEKLNKFEHILTKIEHMAETDENQQYAVQCYVELGTLIASIDELLIKWSQNMMYVPSDIISLKHRTNVLFNRTIDIVTNDIKWAANPNISEYASARLTAACTVITQLESGQRMVSEYIMEQLLSNTKSEFSAGNEYATLQHIDRRFAEFRRKMKLYDDIYRLFVPEFWYLTNQITAQFCIITSESLEKQLSIYEESTDCILNARDTCLEFEEELIHRYHIDSSFFPKISNVLELHLHFDYEAPTIKRILIHSKKQETLHQMKKHLIHIHLHSKTLTDQEKYLKSFDKLKECIINSMESCFKKSNGESSMKLIFNLCLVLEKYALNLSTLLYIAGGKSQQLKDIIPKQFASKNDTKYRLIPQFHIAIRSENVNTNKDKIQLFVIYCGLVYNTCIKVRNMIDYLLNEMCKCLMKKLQHNTKERLYETNSCFINVEELCLELMRSSIMYQFETYLFKEVLLIKKNCKKRLLKEFDVYLLNILRILRKDVFIYFYILFCGHFAKSLFDIILGSTINTKNDFDVNSLLDFAVIFEISAVHFLSINLNTTKQYTINKVKLMIERFMNPITMFIKLIYVDIDYLYHPKKTKFAAMIREIYTHKNSVHIIEKIQQYQLFADDNDNHPKGEQIIDFKFRLQSFSPIIPIQIKTYNKWDCVQYVMTARKLNAQFQSEIAMLCKDLDHL